MSRPSEKALAQGAQPELELLLCCARTHMDAERVVRIKALLKKDIDWAYLIRTALQHGVMPLLYRNLHGTFPDAVPRASMAELCRLFRINARRNYFLTAELLRLLSLLEAHDIRAVPFKGPVLASSIYGDPALRQFTDLDVLVHKQDVLKVKDLFLSLGYRPPLHLAPPQEVAYLRSWSDFIFYHEGKKVTVDLQWDITPKYFSLPLDPACLWERLQPASLLGVEVLNLSSEDLLLVLCVHGTKHGWERLEWICGVAELVRVHQSMDWGWVTAQAASLGAERMHLLGLFLANDMLGAAVPATVLRKAQADPVTLSLAARVRDRLFQDAHGRPGILERCLFPLRARERAGDQLWYCLGLATTPTVGDWTLLSLPSSLSFLYYLLRPIRLLGTYGLRPLFRLILPGR